MREACSTFCCIPCTCMQIFGAIHEPGMQHLLLYTRYLHANMRSCSRARHAAPSVVYEVVACRYEDWGAVHEPGMQHLVVYHLLACKYEGLFMNQTCNTFVCLTDTACKYEGLFMSRHAPCTYFCFIGTASLHIFVRSAARGHCVKFLACKSDKLFFSWF